MQKVSIYKLDRVPVRTEIDEADLVTVTDAAQIRGVTIQAIKNLMNDGTLPIFQFITSGGERIQKFTSREALSLLPKAKGERAGIKKNVYSFASPPRLPLKHVVTSIFRPVRAFAFQ